MKNLLHSNGIIKWNNLTGDAFHDNGLKTFSKLTGDAFYILTKKGTNRASSDVGFVFIAYNLRRIGNIMTKDWLREYLRILLSLFLAISDLIRGNLAQSRKHIYNPSRKLA